MTGVHSYFEETVFPHDRVPDQQVSVKSAIENGVDKFGINEEKGTDDIVGLTVKCAAGTVMQIDNDWINVRSLYRYRHVYSTVLYIDMLLTKLRRDISTLSAVGKNTTYMIMIYSNRVSHYQWRCKWSCWNSYVLEIISNYSDDY